MTCLSKFTLEMELLDRLPFVDVFLSRRRDRLIQQSIYYHKIRTWQYVHYQNFVPLNHQRNLIPCFLKGRLMILTSGTIWGVIIKVKETFLQSGHHECFIDKSEKIDRNKPNPRTVKKKAVHLFVASRGDTIADFLSARLPMATRNTNFAAELPVWSTCICKQKTNRFWMQPLIACTNLLASVGQVMQTELQQDCLKA